MNLKFGVLHFAINQPSTGPEDGWFGQPKYSAPNFEIILYVLTVFKPYMDYFTGSTIVSDPSLWSSLDRSKCSEHSDMNLDKCRLVSCKLKWAGVFYQSFSAVLVLRMFMNECWLRVETFNIHGSTIVFELVALIEKWNFNYFKILFSWFYFDWRCTNTELKVAWWLSLWRRKQLLLFHENLNVVKLEYENKIDKSICLKEMNI